MIQFKDFRIRTKLVTIMVLTGMLVLLLALVAVVASEYARTRTAVTDEIHTLATVVGNNVSAALVFQDRGAADTTLSALGAKPGILAAYLYDANGEVFSRYHAPGLDVDATGEPPFRLSPDAANARNLAGQITDTLKDGHLHVIRPVEIHSEYIGALHIIDDQSELARMVQNVYTVALIILLVSLVLIIVLSARLQRVFSDPVHRLIETMRTVASEKNYATRMTRFSNDEFGELVDVFNVMLSEVQERDAQLANHGQLLEKQVAERTTELSAAVQELEKITREAVEARDAAEAASRAKSEFLATMSHEIRTPMNGVLGMTELLLNSGLEDKQLHFADAIQRSGRNLLGIINDILDFSKIESGKLELDVHDFDLREMVEETAELMAELTQRKGIELTVDLPPDTCLSLRGDSHRISQVLLNLLGNAVKFTSEGDISVRVRILGERNNHWKLRWEVADTGIGIPAEKRDSIFDAFRQADGSTTRQYGGTGLGLAISTKLLALMNGTIGVESEPGVGSTFWFELELERQLNTPARRHNRCDTLNGVKVLVVDDNTINREILLTQTSSWNMMCTAVDSAEAGLAELLLAANAGHPYDCAILDWQMPVVDGIELARRIRSDSRIPALKLAMLSSAGFDDESLRAASVGIDSYLNKPVRQELLFRTLNRLLQDKERPEGDSPNADSEDRSTAARKFAGARILLAEDNPTNQEVAREMLEFEGCIVAIVDNGKQAVEEFRSHAFDLIMMDCHMPVQDGFGAAGEIRTIENDSGSARSVPIIALTADVQKGIRNRCLQAGMDAYLSKPFSGEQLRAALDTWLLQTSKVPLPAPAPVPVAVQTPGESPAHANSGYKASEYLDSTVLDRIRALEQPGGRPILASVVTKFLKGLPESTDQLRAAVAATDGDALFRAAHFLKSGYANLGATPVVEICKAMEDCGRNGDPATAQQLMEQFEAESIRARDALEKLVEPTVHA